MTVQNGHGSGGDDCGAGGSTPVKNGIVEGTNSADLIDVNYTGDPQGDRIDANDSLKNFNDTPFSSDVPSTFYPLPGQPVLGNNRDAVMAYGGDDTVKAAEGDDVVYGGSGNDQVYGASGADVLVGDEGSDSLFGGADMDRLFGGNQDDLLDGGDARDRLFGGNGADSLFGGNGNDDLYGGNDKDLLDGGTGQDLLEGGEGEDTLFGQDGDDTLKGDNAKDLLYGGDGDDSLDGGSANDTLEGGAGQDALTGGIGNDLMDGGSGDDTLDGGGENDTMLGGSGNDQLNGGSGNDQMYGQEGDDTLTGGENNDLMYGGADADTFLGEKGDKIYGGSEGNDHDRLDMSLTPYFRIVDKTVDSDGNGFDGKVEILDDKGHVTGSYTFENIECVPCFTPGTLIATPRGEVPVEDLAEGDLVITRDNGLQPVRWAGRRMLDYATLTRNHHLRPILIERGSLGNGLPERDMLVSPNHRMLVANERTALYFDEHEVLVSAKHLVNHRSVKPVQMLGVVYMHFMFDRHEVVLANGAWTESFQPGDYSLKGVGNSQRNEIYELFPELKEKAQLDRYVTARKTLKRHEASLLWR